MAKDKIKVVEEHELTCGKKCERLQELRDINMNEKEIKRNMKFVEHELLLLHIISEDGTDKQNK